MKRVMRQCLTFAAGWVKRHRAVILYGLWVGVLALKGGAAFADSSDPLSEVRTAVVDEVNHSIIPILSYVLLVMGVGISAIKPQNATAVLPPTLIAFFLMKFGPAVLNAQFF